MESASQLYPEYIDQWFYAYPSCLKELLFFDKQFEVEYGRVYQYIGKSKQEAGNLDNSLGIFKVEVCVGMIVQEASVKSSLFMMIQVGTNRSYSH